MESSLDGGPPILRHSNDQHYWEPAMSSHDDIERRITLLENEDHESEFCRCSPDYTGRGLHAPECSTRTMLAEVAVEWGRRMLAAEGRALNAEAERDALTTKPHSRAGWTCLECSEKEIEGGAGDRGALKMGTKHAEKTAHHVLLWKSSGMVLAIEYGEIPLPHNPPKMPKRGPR